MKKCVRIICTVRPKKRFLDLVSQEARMLQLEGVAHVQPPNTLKIVILGSKDEIDDFIDFLHKESLEHDIESIEVEPFIKDRDYRGIFRIIE